jgi:hypothetical protein
MRFHGVPLYTLAPRKRLSVSPSSRFRRYPLGNHPPAARYADMET